MTGAVELVRPLYELIPYPVRRLMQVRRRTRDWLKRGIVFVHIPKAAGTSINDALYGRSMGHARAQEIRRVAPAAVNSLPFFSVTRNPWDRLVSAWRFAKRGGGTGGKAAGIVRPEQYRVPEFDTFERFVREWLAVRDLHKLDNVFQPQWTFVCDRAGDLIVDFVGRLEDLESTYAFIEEVTGGEVRFLRQNESGPKLDYRSLYTPELADLVAQLYRRDVEMFGYDV